MNDYGRPGGGAIVAGKPQRSFNAHALGELDCLAHQLLQGNATHELSQLLGDADLIFRRRLALTTATRN